MKINIVSPNRKIDRYSHESFKEKARQKHPFLFYLACPYSHPDYIVRQHRYEMVTYVSGLLMKRGLNVYSPITHAHPIAEMVDIPTDWDFWEKIDRQYISVAKELYVLQLAGWDRSKGVSAEMKIATELGVPIRYIRKFNDREVFLENNP